MKRKPHHFKVLEGNGSIRTAIKSKAPEPPEWISGIALEKWNEIVPELERLGIICKLDRALLITFCCTWQTYRESCDLIAKEGIVITGHRDAPRKHPAYPIFRDSGNDLVRMGKLLGLTPRSRQSMDVEEPLDDDDDWSDLIS